MLLLEQERLQQTRRDTRVHATMCRKLESNYQIHHNSDHCKTVELFTAHMKMAEFGEH